ncbi:MAG: hypothetical protein IJD10_05125, partial [Clostridia bacterium]|nr:hypothetical protein [Clostridia bacterium]
MKKLSLILATLMMLTVFVSSFSITFGAAGPMDSFTEVAAPAEEDQINPTSWNYFVGVKQLTDPVGSWSWANTFDGKEACWGMNTTVTLLDCDLKTLYWESNDVDFTDKGASTVKEIVFADYYTQSGLGDGGRIRAKAETFEKMTVIYSADGENWSSVGFTVAYHTAESTFTSNNGTAYPVDTYWHLVFDHEIPAVRYFGIHTSEAAAWDADDHTPRLGIVLSWKYTYLVKGTGDGTAVPPVTEAPVTDAPVTDAPQVNIPEKPAVFTVNTPSDVIFTCDHVADGLQMSLNGTQSILTPQFEAWAGYQKFLDGDVPYTFFLCYSEPTWVSDIQLLAKSTPSDRFLKGVSVYYSNGVPGAENWVKADITHKNFHSDGFFHFTLNEPVAAKYFMLHMETPNPGITGQWKGFENFFSTYTPDVVETEPVVTDPVATDDPATNAPETNAPETGDTKTDAEN